MLCFEGVENYLSILFLIVMDLLKVKPREILYSLNNLKLENCSESRIFIFIETFISTKKYQKNEKQTRTLQLLTMKKY